MSDLVVIAFSDEEKAEDVRKKILGLTAQYLIEIEDAVVAVKQENGHIKLNQLATRWRCRRCPVRCGARLSG